MATDLMLFSVAVPEDPAQTVGYAAQEFSEWTGKLTGAAPEIVTNDTPQGGFFITLDPKLGDDDFHLTSKGGLYTVAGGKRYISPGVKSLFANDPPLPRLTPRQNDILASLTRGLTNRDIALQLGVCETRVEQLVNALFSTIGAANRTEAVSIALRKHLLKI